MKELIWYEKYRPIDVDDMVLPESTESFVEECIEDGGIPHLLFYGPQGSGKTTLARILITGINAVSMELNASSDDRGVATVKGKIKLFASSKSDRPKIVFLDEADGLTTDAQEALRNTIETYSNSTKFILTANNIGAIISPIQSRCMCIEMSQFEKDALIEHCEKILKQEDVDYDDDDVRKIVDLHYPDIRTVINSLQMCSVDGELDIDAAQQYNIDFELFAEHMDSGKLRAIRRMMGRVRDFTPAYRYLFDRYIRQVDPDAKPKIATLIAEYMYRDRLVVDKEINFAACCVSIMMADDVEIDF